MPGEVAAGELGERRVAVDRALRAEPVLGCANACSAPARRPAHRVAAQGRPQQQVHERLSRGRHAGRIEPVAQLPARLRAVLAQRRGDQGGAPIRIVRAHALLGEAPQAPGGQRRRGERVQPRPVLAADEVQGPAVQPADHQRALLRERPVDVGRRQALAARPDSEPEAARVLPLHREQPLDDRDRVPRGLAGEHLRGKSVGVDGHAARPAGFEPATSRSGGERSIH